MSGHIPLGLQDTRAAGKQTARASQIILLVLMWLLTAGAFPGHAMAQDEPNPPGGQQAQAEPSDAAANGAPSPALPPKHAFGAWSLVPPAAAIVLAIVLRRVILALLVAVVLGVAIHQWPQAMTDSTGLAGAWALLTATVVRSCEGILWKNLTDGDLLRVFAFSLMMGAMVGVMYASGGMHGLVRVFTPWASNRRRGQLVGWFMGILVFFDDYANALLLGNTLRPVTDRLRISREKLAYLVDSTAAPVAGIAVISTWVATEIQYINEGYLRLGLPPDSFQGMTIFIETIPYRFYPLLALIFVVLVAWIGRDFGPMLRAERRVIHGKGDEGLAANIDEAPEITPPEGKPQRWFNGVVPVLVVLGVTLWLILETGYASLAAEAAENGKEVTVSFMQAFNSGDSYIALVYGSLAGLLTAVALAWTQQLLPGRNIERAASYGARMVIGALTVLWLSACLKDVTGSDGLQTAEYVGGWLQRFGLAGFWLPTLAFVLSGVVAFSTGTSWGTMGILMPLVISVSYQLLLAEAGGTSLDPYNSVLLASVGGVLAGAIWGDHCSPISDTTVLSSVASGCNHFAHVWTQLPYALVVGTVAIVFGTLPAGLGISPWLSLAVSTAVLVGWLFLFARRAEG